MGFEKKVNIMLEGIKGMCQFIDGWNKELMMDIKEM